MANNTNRPPSNGGNARAEERHANLKNFSDSLESFDKEARSVASSVETIKGSAASIAGTTGKVVGDVKNKTKPSAGMLGSRSIIGKASQNIFEFPVFMSSSVPVDMATAVNSLLEQIYASYLQMAISMQPVVSADEVDKGVVFQKYKTDTTRYLEYAEEDSQFYMFDACHNEIVNEDEGAVFEFNMVDISASDVALIQESLDYVPLSEFDFFFEASGHKPRSSKKYADEQQKIFTKDQQERAKRKSLEDRRDQLAERQYKKNDEQRAQNEEERKQRRDTRDEAANQRANREEQREVMKQALEDKIYSGDKDKVERGELPIVPGAKMYFDKAGELRKRELEDKKDLRADKEAKRDESRLAADLKVKAPTMLDETKIQKLNTMKPLMMTVGVRVKAADGHISDMIDYVVGVKTHCRVVKADVLPDVAQYPNKEMNKLAHTARWRAGEIKFIDYFFNRKAKKQAAYDSRDPNRKWYHRLYTLAHSKGSSGVAKKVTGKRHVDGMIPNATLVITKADVDMIEAETGIDLLKGSTAASLCAEMYMIGMVVVDTDAQSVKMILPDIHRDYEVHSIASINKQLAALDSANDVSREVSKLIRGH